MVREEVRRENTGRRKMRREENTRRENVRRDNKKENKWEDQGWEKMRRKIWKYEKRKDDKEKYVYFRKSDKNEISRLIKNTLKKRYREKYIYYLPHVLSFHLENMNSLKQRF